MGNKKPHKDRNQEAIKKAKIKEDMKHPINQLLNETDDEGNLKFPIAPILRKYLLANPDPAINAMRLSNSLVHELRWHKDRAKNYLDAYKSKEKVEMYDKDGKQLTKAECYTGHIQEVQVGFAVLTKLREHLVNGLLPTVDEEIFSLEKYNDFVMKTKKIVEDMGYDLFPDKVETIEPL